MKNWLHKRLSGLGSAFPSTVSPYWRTLPVAGMKLLLTGSFLIAVLCCCCHSLWSGGQFALLRSARRSGSSYLGPSSATQMNLSSRVLPESPV
jgi:hypothetical protein